MSDELETLLKQSTMRVVFGRTTGTCFAVTPTIAVTCRHVVESVPPDGLVDLYEAEGTSAPRKARVLRALPPMSAGTQLQGAERWPDLALLHVEGANSFPTTVLLDAGRPETGATLVVGGFPAQAAIPYQTRHYKAGTSVNVDEGGHTSTQLTEESIDPGQSGAAVMTQDGFVCGYVRVTRAEKTTLGGFLVSMADVLSMVPELSQAYQVPGTTADAWLEHITGLELKNHGREENGNRFEAEPEPSILDLELSQVELANQGEIRSWKVAAGTADLDQQLETGALGEGVLEAVDYWSRRHPLVSKRQVDLLGRLLFRGLMPTTINDFLQQMDKHEPPIIRLRMVRDDPLCTIPWEYAAGLATSKHWAFVRYVPTRKAQVSPLKKISALIVVNHIDGIDPSILAKALDEKLATTCRHIDFKVAHSQNISEFIGLARQGWDIVHYVGTGRSTGALQFPREYPIGESRDELIEWDVLYPYLIGSRAKLAVLQLGLSRFDVAATLATYLDLLERAPGIEGQVGTPEPGEARALILAQHVTTMDHVMKFNTPLYKAIDKGASVERAVQDARGDLFDLAPDAADSREKDHAAFGTVSVVTTAEGNIRLLERDFEVVDKSGGGGHFAQPRARAAAPDPEVPPLDREPARTSAPAGEGFEQ